MFTGIIEALGEVAELKRENSNLNITVRSQISSSLKIDQSVAHNGVCLTVTDIRANTHTVTAIDETLKKSNLEFLTTGDMINLEQSLKIGDRLDGHFVQGHVDAIAKLLNIEDKKGSYLLTCLYYEKFKSLIVHKGSICINGISLTLINVTTNQFTVAIIPYTWQSTNVQYLKPGDEVNIEFDVIGKYVNRIMELQN
jgi:riboflavin synthase